MARKSKENIIEELTKMGVDFDKRESWENLNNLLEIETRNRKPTIQPPVPEDEDLAEELQPLSDMERIRLKELERMARKGRKIDQPTPAEMIELGRLRQRNKITE